MCPLRGGMNIDFQKIKKKITCQRANINFQSHMHHCGTSENTLQTLIIIEVIWLLLVKLNIQMPIWMLSHFIQLHLKVSSLISWAETLKSSQKIQSTAQRHILVTLNRLGRTMKIYISYYKHFFLSYSGIVLLLLMLLCPWLQGTAFGCEASWELQVQLQDLQVFLGYYSNRSNGTRVTIEIAQS